MPVDVLNPRMPARQSQALAMLGYFYLKQGFAQRAMTVFAALEVLDPPQPRHVCALALACRRAGRLEQALACLDRLALRGAIRAPYHLLRAQVLQGLLRSDEAAQSMQAYRQAMEGIKAPKERHA